MTSHDPDYWDDQYFKDNKSDSSDEYDPFEEYGDDMLAQAVEDPERVRKLLAEGVAISAYAVKAAVEFVKPETLRVLIHAGADVNIRPEAADGAAVKRKPLFSSMGSEDVVMRFEEDSKEWYPMTCAAYIPGLRTIPDGRQKQEELMSLLLDAGTDFYATYRQPLEPRRSQLSVYPGEVVPVYPDSDDEEVRAARPYGDRSVIHAILEDGMRVEPILKQNPSSLDADRRDPRGRTVFLSMCRSPLGADAAMDSVVLDADLWKLDGMPDPLDISPTTRPSLFDAMKRLNPDMLAVDEDGKNALHHLLESRDDANQAFRPPKIRSSLLYLLQHHPVLINQPDRRGDYPLHAALQRVRFFHRRDRWRETADLHCLIDDLLGCAGVDAKVTDSRGNTALHYVADEGLGETVLGEQARRRFEALIGAGADVNARNKQGRSALELFVRDDGSRTLGRTNHYSHSIKTGDVKLADPVVVDDEVFGLFQKAGVRWNDVDEDGRTALHLLAGRKETYYTRGPAWAKKLLAHGVDPAVKDNVGRTAADLAREVGNGGVLEVLNAAR